VKEKNMAVCSFHGHKDIYDADMDTMLQSSVNQIVAKNKSVKFQIYHHGQFSERCLLAALRAKAQNPQKVTICLILSNAYYEDYIQQYNVSIPFCMVDKIITHNTPAATERDYSIPYKKTMRWMIENSTHLVSYVYQTLYEYESRLLEFAQQTKNVKIISVTRDETKEAILKYAAFMSEKERDIFTRRNKGEKQTAIAKALGLTHERSRQVLQHGCRTIREKLRWNWYKRIANAEQSCSIFNVGEITDEAIRVFKQIIRFLVVAYGIKKFYVEYSCVRPDLICVLREQSTPFNQIHITALTDGRIADDLKDITDGACPPCDVVECIGRVDSENGSDPLGVIAEMVERSVICICNFSALSSSEELQKLAAQKPTILLDLGKTYTGAKLLK